ncbi:hypothetical protein [Streptomyces sp. MUM 16J]|uniref:hypothetical protein n=1 Tax=Streptomyces sp. MUM 16J TaxID=2791988 RepID=UPI001F03A73B|nr:hypothetical protein [Streptomyces sp. MUM 16J]MCH0559501.1 hypothetical protein [Streptomyces sp. MUM 16J]
MNRLDQLNCLDRIDPADRVDHLDHVEGTDRVRSTDRSHRVDRAGEPIYAGLVAEWRAQGRTVPAEPDALWTVLVGLPPRARSGSARP